MKNNIKCSAHDYPLCYGNSEKELLYFLKFLVNQNYLEEFEEIEFGPEYEITVNGWEYLSEVSQDIYSKQTFVAMWFAKKMDEVYKNGYKIILEDFKLSPIHMKFLQHNEKIDNRIIAEIRKSRFLIADITNIRHNVLFEAGFALGLNIPVIWTCKKSYFKKVEKIFDTRQYNIIKWKDIEDLKIQLKDRIEATIPDLP